MEDVLNTKQKVGFPTSCQFHLDEQTSDIRRTCLTPPPEQWAVCCAVSGPEWTMMMVGSEFSLLRFIGMSVLDNPLSGRPERRKRVLSSSSSSEDESSQSRRQSTSTTSNRLIRCLKGCLKRKLEKAAAGTIRVLLT